MRIESIFPQTWLDKGSLNAVAPVTADSYDSRELWGEGEGVILPAKEMAPGVSQAPLDFLLGDPATN